MKYDVYAVSDWPEEYGALIAIYTGKEFASVNEAREAGQRHYSDLEILVEESEQQ